MPSFNSVTLMGNITREIEKRYTPGGTAVCDIGLAVNRKYKSGDGEQQEEVLFIDCTVWGRTAESCAQYLSKGRPILVSGYLRSESWEAKDGTKRTKIKVNAVTVQFLGSGQEGGGQGGGGQSGGQGGERRPASEPAQRQAPKTTTRGGGEQPPDDDFNLDDIPF